MRLIMMVKSILWDIAIVTGLVLLLVGGLLVNDIFPLTEQAIEPGSQELTGIDYSSWEEEISLDYARFKAPTREIEVTIPQGATAFQTADILVEKDLVDRTQFMKAVMIFPIARRIKSGTYVFTSETELIDILDKILLD